MASPNIFVLGWFIKGVASVGMKNVTNDVISTKLGSMLNVHADNEKLLSCLLFDGHGRNWTFAIVCMTTCCPVFENYITAAHSLPVKIIAKAPTKTARTDHQQTENTPLFSTANLNDYIHATPQKHYILTDY